MVNYLGMLSNPQINYEIFYEIMCNFQKGGLKPEIYNEFISAINSLPPISARTPSHYAIFDKFGLTDISGEDFSVIIREVHKRGIDKNKFCWHPDASPTNCNVDNNGKIIISAAHSIQNNGVLSKIVKNGHVMTYALDKAEFNGKELGKNHASIFWGFCNKHDAIFKPIEIQSYTQTPEQNFLFAYRGFVVSSHKKNEASTLIKFGERAKKDIEENKKIFDDAIRTNDFSIIETEVFELPAFYPIAVSSAFYLDYDFDGNPIPHPEDERMEDIFVTLYPVDNKTYFLLSYFTNDKHLYGNLGNQLRIRNNLKSDISILIAAHTENIYFNPTYYEKFIKKYEKILEVIMLETQFDSAQIDENNELNTEFSFTPSDYLNNPYNINFFESEE